MQSCCCSTDLGTIPVVYLLLVIADRLLLKIQNFMVFFCIGNPCSASFSGTMMMPVAMTPASVLTFERGV